jgi:hypothetical protein
MFPPKRRWVYFDLPCNTTHEIVLFVAPAVGIWNLKMQYVVESFFTLSFSNGVGVRVIVIAQNYWI